MDTLPLTTAFAATGAGVRDAAEADAVNGVQPSVVAAPADTDQTAAVLRACAEHELAVVVRGAGTKQDWGLPPQRCDVVLDLSGLDRLVEHAAGDLIATAGAGMPLARLQDHLAGSTQRLGIDEMVAGTTVGGLVAASPSGPRRMATGSVRDLLIGITIVRADGVVARGGGKVVKNVAGYDLGKLMTGSFGTLGAITEATFRLHPLPRASRWLVAEAGTVVQAQSMVAGLVHSQAVPAALEVTWPTTGPGAVAVLLEGTPEGVARRSEAVEALLGGSPQAVDDVDLSDLSDPSDPSDPSDSSDSSDMVAHLLRYPWQGHPDATGLKVTCRLSAIGEVLTAARRAGVHLQGSAGVGVLYGTLPGGTEPATVRHAVEELRSVAVAHGGSLVVLTAPAEVRQVVDPWGPVPGLDLMRRVKAQFDPDRRFAPGRFVGGI